MIQPVKKIKKWMRQRQKQRKAVAADNSSGQQRLQQKEQQHRQAQQIRFGQGSGYRVTGTVTAGKQAHWTAGKSGTPDSRQIRHTGCSRQSRHTRQQQAEGRTLGQGAREERVQREREVDGDERTGGRMPEETQRGSSEKSRSGSLKTRGGRAGEQTSCWGAW
jgi:hypothetical protein